MGSAINAISRADIHPQLKDSFTHWLAIAEISGNQAFQADFDLSTGTVVA